MMSILSSILLFIRFLDSHPNESLCFSKLAIASLQWAIRFNNSFKSRIIYYGIYATNISNTVLYCLDSPRRMGGLIKSETDFTPANHCILFPTLLIFFFLLWKILCLSNSLVNLLQFIFHHLFLQLLKLLIPRLFSPSLSFCFQFSLSIFHKALYP